MKEYFLTIGADDDDQLVFGFVAKRFRVEHVAIMLGNVIEILPEEIGKWITDKGLSGLQDTQVIEAQHTHWGQIGIVAPKL